MPFSRSGSPCITWNLNDTNLRRMKRLTRCRHFGQVRGVARVRIKSQLRESRLVAAAAAAADSRILLAAAVQIQATYRGFRGRLEGQE